MTELSFLVELLLEHKLQKSTKDLIKQRIREVQALNEIRPPKSMHVSLPLPSQPAVVTNPTMAPQAPSTLLAMARHAQEESGVPIVVPDAAMVPAEPPPKPVEVIAQTPQTIAALASRAKAIKGSLDPETGRPRKF